MERSTCSSGILWGKGILPSASRRREKPWEGVLGVLCEERSPPGENAHLRIFHDKPEQLQNVPAEKGVGGLTATIFKEAKRSSLERNTNAWLPKDRERVFM